MNYQLTPLESYTKDLYREIGITTPLQLDMITIAVKLNIWLHFEEVDSCAIERENLCSIIINRTLPFPNQWEEFGHELCHVLRQFGNQYYMPKAFRELQEAKAENFALHFCVPTFMLLHYEIANYYNDDGVQFVMGTFNVTKHFAIKRLEHFKKQINQANFDDEFRKHKEPVFNYSKSIEPKTIPKYAEDIVKLAISRKRSRRALHSD
jgi:Zn-dependent peptidase ImmA (M78 family)